MTYRIVKSNLGYYKLQYRFLYFFWETSLAVKFSSLEEAKQFLKALNKTQEDNRNETLEVVKQ